MYLDIQTKGVMLLPFAVAGKRVNIHTDFRDASPS